MQVAAGGFSKRLATSLQVQHGESEDPLQLLDSIVEIVNHSDTYMAGHSSRVAELSAGLARLVGLSADEVQLVRRAGSLHDIGKVGIPEKVLRKHGPLTDEEMHLVRLHPIFGASLLARVRGTDRLIPIVLHHHERWDGSGYPAGLSMTDIPRESRIIAVADAYDAMTSYRPYGETLSAEEALTQMRECSGSQFEPLLVDAMHDAFLYGMLGQKTPSIPYAVVGHAS